MIPSVIVIGAGMGGLAAAIRLARSGFSVRVLEARPEPGGLAAGVRYEDFSFDAGPYILLERPGLEWSFEKLGLNLSELISLLSIEDIYEVQSAGGTRVRFYSDLGKTASSFDKQWPGSGRRYERFVEEMTRISRALRPMLHLSRPGILGLVRANALQHAPFLMKPLAAVIAAANLPTPIAEAVAIWTHVAGQATGQAPSPLAFVPALMHSVGAYYPEGGIGRIPQVLEKASADAGVRFQYSTRVIRIRCENGRTIGVETSTGEFMPAAVVLSNSAALGTYLQLLDPPPPHVDSLKKLPLQSPGVCAYLAARGRVAPPYLQFKLAAPDEKCRLLVQPAIVDPHTHQAEWAAARLLAPMDYAEAQRVGPQGQSSYLDRLLAEQWWREDFRDIRVLGKRIPHQWGSEYNLYANSMNPVMTARFMRQGRIAHRSPYVRGLYLAGSSTHPGQWVSFCMISGILAAECIIDDMARP